MELNTLMSLYISELEEEIFEFSNTVLELEKKESNKIELLNDLYVNVHTLKGNSNTLLNTLNKQENPFISTLSDICRLTHDFEDVIEHLKSKSDDITQHEFEILYNFELVINSFISFLDDDFDMDFEILNSFLDEIKLFLDRSNQVSQNIDSKGLKNEMKNENIFKIVLSTDSNYKHGYLHIIYQELENKYGNCYFSPTKQELIQNKDFDEITIQISSNDKLEETENYLNSFEDIQSVTVLPFNSLNSIQINSHISNTSKIEVRKPIEKLDNKKKHKYHSIRISPKRIDNVYKHTSKLVILNNKLEEFIHQNDFFTKTKRIKELETIFDEFKLHVDSLRESVLEMRLTPFEQLFSRFPRDVNELSKKYGKPIQLSFDGSTTEIDKSILDELFDPFMHLIRNSIIHGIESTDERIQLGKPVEGTISISARHDKNRVIITLVDDGKGIDANILKRVAIDKKIMSESLINTMTYEEIIELIFKPGFSTSKDITEYSGRGVGMDAVRKKLEKLNGSINIDSQQNIGTAITIYLPLTTAIIEGMITKINDEYFTFQISQVEEVISIKKSDIKETTNKSYIFLRNKEVPIIFSEEFFGLSRTKKDSSPFTKLMILRAHNQLIALTIDKYLGQQNIVVKSMHPFLQKAKGISNCNILGDGSISLIVDSNELIGHV